MDECRESPQICGPHAICNNQPGTFRCECQDGFQFASDGRTCVGKGFCSMCLYEKYLHLSFSYTALSLFSSASQMFVLRRRDFFVFLVSYCMCPLQNWCYHFLFYVIGNIHTVHLTVRISSKCVWMNVVLLLTGVKVFVLFCRGAAARGSVSNRHSWLWRPWTRSLQLHRWIVLHLLLSAGIRGRWTDLPRCLPDIYSSHLRWNLIEKNILLI